MLRFNYEMENEGKLPFLDVTASERHDGYHSAVHTKETSIVMCLNGSSECPERYKECVIKAHVTHALSHSTS